MSDLGRDLSNPHQWEDGVAMGLSIYGGAYGMASKASIAGKSSAMLTAMPSTVTMSRPFSLNPRLFLKREHFKIHLRITNPGRHGVGVLRQGQLDVGHRDSFFFIIRYKKTTNFQKIDRRLKALSREQTNHFKYSSSHLFVYSHTGCYCFLG